MPTVPNAGDDGRPGVVRRRTGIPDNGAPMNAFPPGIPLAKPRPGKEGRGGLLTRFEVVCKPAGGAFAGVGMPLRDAMADFIGSTGSLETVEVDSFTADMGARSLMLRFRECAGVALPAGASVSAFLGNCAL